MLSSGNIAAIHACDTSPKERAFCAMPFRCLQSRGVPAVEVVVVSKMLEAGGENAQWFCGLGVSAVLC